LRNSSKDKFDKRLHLQWGLAGISLAGLLFIMAGISSGFDYALSDAQKPIIYLVSLMMAAGAVYIFVIHCFRDTVFTRALMAWIIGLGFLLRLGMFASTPMLEDDHYRYLWDGGVLANGFNPYKYSPREILIEGRRDIPEPLRHLAKGCSPIVERINYPWLRTIYPPVAQFAFALAHLISPWNLSAWRLILIMIDLTTLYLLFLILRNLNLPLMGLVIYWWNPLLIKEIFNSGHMDVIIFPFLLAAFLFTIQGRYLWASGALGFAVGVKFWPAILLPIVLRPVFRDPKRLVWTILIFVCLSGAMFSPFYMTGLDPASGFTAYKNYWEINDALFMLFLWAVRFILGILNLDALRAQFVTRVVVACVLLAWVVWLIRKDDRNPIEISRGFLLVIAALFLLSPTQFPWYYFWMLPFLAIYPRASLFFFRVLLPFYYVRFYFDTKGLVEIHDNGIVWLEYVPVWGLMVLEWYEGRNKTDSGKA